MTTQTDFQFSVFTQPANLPQLSEKGVLFNAEHLRLFEALYIESAQRKLMSLAPKDPIERAEFDSVMEQISARMELINELISYHNTALRLLNMNPANATDADNIMARADSLARKTL